MTKKNILLSTVAIGLCFLPGLAAADDMDFDISAAPPQEDTSGPPPTETSEFTLGTQWVGGTNTGQYGRYNGFTNQGFDFLLGFEFSGQDSWDSGDTFYYEVSGSNLSYQTGDRLARGFRDSSFSSSTNIDVSPQADINVQFGNQGSWGVHAGYRSISYAGNIMHSIYTVQGNEGVLNNGFIPYGGASNDPLTVGATTDMTVEELTPALERFQTGTRRDQVNFGGHVLFEDWTLSTDLTHEHKEGTLVQSLRAAESGTTFTQPVDYDTDRFNVRAAYIQRGFQAVIDYTYSRFEDNNHGIVLPYPYSAAALSSSSGPYAQAALYSTPPSNDAHYLTVMLAGRISPQTQIRTNFRAGVELQDDTFPANSADPNLSPLLGDPTYDWFANLNSMNQGTSGFSPNAKATIYQGDVTVSSQLAANLHGRATYRFDSRDVSIDEFGVWIGGSQPDRTANTEVFVVPQEWFKQTGEVELDYTINRDHDTKLSVGYAYNDTHRTNAQVNDSRTHTVTAQLRSMLGQNTMGRISYEHANRDGTLVFGRPWGNLEEGMPEVFGTPSGAYYQAPMDSNSVTARLDYVPQGPWSAGIFVQYEDRNFDYPHIPAAAPAGDTNLVMRGMGIEQITSLTIGPDVNYQPSEDVNLHFYYTYERSYYDNTGNGACSGSNTGNCLGSAGYFRNEYTSDTHTAGVSASWQATPKLNIEAEYNYSSGAVAFDEFNGVMVVGVTQQYQNVVDYPDIDSRMHDASVSASYQFTDRIEGALYARYNHFDSNDWDYTTLPIQPSVDGGSSISILSPGYARPEYNVTTIGVAVRVRF